MQNVVMIENVVMIHGKDGKECSHSQQTAQLELQGLRILLVDDSADNQKIFYRFLTAAGAVVELASNGEEAIEKYLQQGLGPIYDLIIMDVHMPVLDGLASTRIIRTAGFKGPIIALTADDRIAKNEGFAALGFSDVRQKPIDRRALVAAVRHAWMAYCGLVSSSFRKEGALK
jgi:CheY-like chemotaxis protein